MTMMEKMFTIANSKIRKGRSNVIFGSVCFISRSKLIQNPVHIFIEMINNEIRIEAFEKVIRSVKLSREGRFRVKSLFGVSQVQ